MASREVGVSVFLLLVAALAAGAGAMPDREAYHPPRFHLPRLDDHADDVLRALEREGMLLVTGAPGLEGARTEALLGLEECARSGNGDHVRVASLSGGVVRQTIATKSSSGLPPEVESQCPGFAGRAQALRSATREVTRRVVRALDRGMGAGEGDHQGGCNGAGVLGSVGSGEQLEHLHVYRKPAGRSGAEGAATLEMHTDLGVLLAMAPALYLRGEEVEETAASGLLVESVGGQVKHVSMPGDGILLMAGEGLNHWVPHGREFHVPKHMMVMPESGAAPMSRAWYGIMVLPAAEAELQTGEGPSGLTYGDFKGVARRRLEGAEEEGDENILEKMRGVGCSHGRQLLEGLDVQGSGDGDDSDCGEGEIYCWMQCMPTKAVGDCPAEDIKCADPEGKIWPNETAEMCPDCQLRCERPPDPETNRVCNPRFTPVSMYMSGFTWGWNGNDPCLVYLFQGIVLDSEWKFVVACFVTVGLALACDGLGRVRVLLEARPGWLATAGATVIFFAQAFLSYALMLVAMTYKGELFLSLLAGLAMGYAVGRARGAKSVESVELCCRTAMHKGSKHLATKQSLDESHELLSADSTLRCCKEQEK